MKTLMNGKPARKPRNVLINPDALHKARVGALRSRKTLGEWLEEAKHLGITADASSIRKSASLILKVSKCINQQVGEVKHPELYYIRPLARTDGGGF